MFAYDQTRLKLMENVSSFESLFIGEGNEEGDGINLFGPVVQYSIVWLALSTSVYVIETPHANEVGCFGHFCDLWGPRSF